MFLQSFISLTLTPSISVSILRLLASSWQVANSVSPMATLYRLSWRCLVSRNPFWSYPETTSEHHCAPLPADFDQLIQHLQTSCTTFGGMECTLLRPRKAHTKLHVEVFQDWKSGT